MSKKLKYKPGDLVRYTWNLNVPRNFLKVIRHEGYGDYIVYDTMLNRDIRVNAWNTVKVMDSVPEELLWD